MNIHAHSKFPLKPESGLNGPPADQNIFASLLFLFKYFAAKTDVSFKPIL